MIKRVGYIVGLLLAAVCVYADTIQYADTFKLQDQPATTNDDAFLLDLLAEQGRQLREQELQRQLQDSLRRDSLFRDLLYRDSVMRAELALLHDSIVRLGLSLGHAEYDTTRQEELVAVEEADPVLLQMDSIARRLAQNEHINEARVERSIFKDVQADLEDINRSLTKRTYWSRELNCLTHLTQNYISSNWYKGGNSSLTALVQLKGYYNYKKDNLAWENNLEWRTGATTTGKADTLRHFNITDDMFRVQSKVGYQVLNKFYVAGSMELNTTLWNCWEANTKKAKTASFSPLKFYLNAGVDYKPVSGLNINFSPAVYKLIYSLYDSERVNVESFGIDNGTHVKNEFGSSVRVNYKWKPLRELSLDTEFYFYTNYKGVEIDWEVNADFIINRFLTTRLSLHPRYCTKEIKDGDDHAKIQFKELLSIGFAHKFR